MFFFNLKKTSFLKIPSETEYVSMHEMLGIECKIESFVV